MPAIEAGAATAPAPVASSNAIVAPDDGLGTLSIVLLGIGGALALAGAGYATVRVHRQAAT